MAEGQSLSRKKVVITDRFAMDSLLWLQQQPQLEILRTENPQVIPADQLVGAHGLLIRSRTLIDEKLLKKARQLQVIITATSGFDHIDLEACQKWGITVMHTPNANVESAAQLTWALALGCAVRMGECHDLIESENWRRENVVGLELSGHNYGIVGLGRIGRRVARHAQAFGMNVFAADPYVDDEQVEKLGVQKLSFEDLLKTAEIVSFHVPKTLETENMLNRDHFSALARPLIVVNTSRGSVINEADLIEALKLGQVRSVGLDVFAEEPLRKESPLRQMAQVLLTPHIGANTDDAFSKASQLAAEKLVRFFQDGSTSDTLPPRVPWYGATPVRAGEP